jgi:hypothetical protein
MSADETSAPDPAAPAAPPLKLRGTALVNPATRRAVVLLADSAADREAAATAWEGDLHPLKVELVAIGEDCELLDEGAERLAAVVLLEPSAAHDGPATAERQGTVDALVLVTAHVDGLLVHRKPLHRVAEVLTGTGGLVRLAYREPADALHLVRDLAAGERP